jgi:2-hydroxy-6-oxonona-2,4-dienedioate hydrolase
MTRVTVGGRAVLDRRYHGTDAAAAPVLLVHGLGCSSEAYRPLLRLWRAGGAPRSGLAPDMPGYGRTGRPRALDIDGLAAWSIEYLDALGVPRVHVIGHSMGCQVALALARQAPARVASVVLVGPTTGRRCEGLLRYGLGLLADSVFESLRWNWTLTRMALQMGARRYVSTVVHMLRDQPIELAGLVRCPVLALRGLHDHIVSADAATRLASALPRGIYRQLPVGAHALQFTHPAEFWAVAGEFVDDAGG